MGASLPPEIMSAIGGLLPSDPKRPAPSLSLPGVVANTPPGLEGKTSEGLWSSLGIGPDDPVEMALKKHSAKTVNKTINDAFVLGSAENQRAALLGPAEQMQIHQERTKKLMSARAFEDMTGTPEVQTANPDGSPDTKKLADMKKQMANFGITLDQHKKAYMPRLSEMAYQNVRPALYGDEKARIIQTAKAVFDPRKKANGDPGFARMSYAETDDSMKQSEDAWRMYLGLPQVRDSFEVSDDRPGKAKDKGTIYYKMKGLPDILGWSKSVKGTIEELADKKSDHMRGGTFSLGVFKISKGEDDKGHYVSYYDIYDFNAPMADKIGHPFEVYERVYYDPKTFKVVKPRGN